MSALDSYLCMQGVFDVLRKTQVKISHASTKAATHTQCQRSRDGVEATWTFHLPSISLKIPPPPLLPPPGSFCDSPRCQWTCLDGGSRKTRSALLELSWKLFGFLLSSSSSRALFCPLHFMLKSRVFSIAFGTGSLGSARPFLITYENPEIRVHLHILFFIHTICCCSPLSQFVQFRFLSTQW